MSQSVERTHFEMAVNDYLSNYTFWDPKKNQLDVTTPGHTGLFGVCTVTLWALTSKYPSDTFVKVNWSGQDIWRDSDQAGENLFNLYFEPNTNVDTRQLPQVLPLDYHGVYSALPFNKLNPYVQNYFVPSNAIRKKQEELVSKYNIDYEKTVALWYRGTDKWIELSPIPPRYHILETARLLATDDDLRVLVQTDQEQIRDECMMHFGKRGFYFDELPVTSSLTGVHHIPAESRGMSNFQFGINLLAVVNIIARCRYIVSGTGNLAFWACLYRGSAKNTAQFRPRAPDLISNYEEKLGTANVASNPNRNSFSPFEDDVYALRFQNTLLQSENNRLRSENTQVRSAFAPAWFELNAIRNSVMYRCMKFLASKIDRLFPDKTRRGRMRKRVTHWLSSRHRLSPASAN
ncbi:MAG: hypothetical protein ACLP5V_08565 [Candidatus Bathyarchaeia archaeon]